MSAAGLDVSDQRRTAARQGFREANRQTGVTTVVSWEISGWKTSGNFWVLFRKLILIFPKFLEIC